MARDSRNILAFIALAFGLAWLLWIPLLLDSFQLHHFGRSLAIFGLTGSFAPTFATVLLTHRSTGRRMPSTLFPPPMRWRIGIILVPSALIAAGYILLPLLVPPAPIHLHLRWSTIAALVSLFPSILSGPLGEETGWRGFLQPQLSQRVGPTLAAILTGLIWSLWHLPLFFVHGWEHPPWWMFVMILTAASVILAYGFNLSGGSILASILGHFTLNQSSGIHHALELSVGHAIPHEDGFTLGSVALIALLLVLATKGRLASANTKFVRDRKIDQSDDPR